MTDTRLQPQQYFEIIDADTERLLEMAARGLEAPVPSCPGWTVADVASHVAMVYEHKVRVMADSAWPDPWPPADFADRPAVDFLRDAKSDLFDEFARHEMTDTTTTFSADDSTIAFWARRMALEITIHRLDGELAHEAATPVSAEVAVDGIDEILRVMLAGPWWDGRVDTAHPIDAAVAVETDGSRWVCDVTARRVTVSDQAPTPPVTTITGDPEAVFRWLWGRSEEDLVSVHGEHEVAADFRARLRECTG